MREGTGELRTLGLLEDTLLDTGLQRLVEERVEHVLRDGDVVVALDVLLELLATGRVKGQQLARQTQNRLAGSFLT